jgi:hypothetical protein
MIHTAMLIPKFSLGSGAGFGITNGGPNAFALIIIGPENNTNARNTVVKKFSL